MIYNDGFATDNNLRFVSCPRCGNEEYSEKAQYCRLCGLSAYNECDGSQDYDDFGNVIGFSVHKNIGNARYCEFCGKPTKLFKEKLLKPYTEVQTEPNEDPFPFDEALPFN